MLRNFLEILSVQKSLQTNTRKEASKGFNFFALEIKL